ncbi:hypothetical protein B1A87_005220 [Arthrobacter sp. KBS0703]|uniref:XkdQ/YqbQ family protein n=1 Tax=Arthrobacter sp. KBS0703 TaxID=1955698 RepID=UPI00098E8AAC|nr:hypothetical protein [Arthrobacter sp. KBS0703]TSE15397.1 hypothetical protein B1A87_005220 [Arthrobacter sp. KBS0703]
MTLKPAPQPFSADAVAKVSESVRHYYKAVAYPLDGEPITLDVLDLQITFSEDWSPHISADITCAMPESQADIDALDGRKSTRVEIELGYDLDSQERETQIVADLMIFSRELRYSSDETSMNITASSDERRVQGQTFFGTETLDTSGLIDYVASILAAGSTMSEIHVLSEYSPTFGAGEIALLEKPKASTMNEPRPNENAWDLIDEIQQRTGTWIYCKNGRDWTIEPRPEIATTPHHTLTTGTDGTVLSANMTTDREKFYNRVVLTYKWKARFNEWSYTRTGQAFISYGDFNIATVGEKTYTEEIDKAASQTQADAAARNKLARLLSKGHTYDVTALALYSVRPGQTIRAQLFGADENLLVQSVTFSPGSGLMDLVLRRPERNEII